MDREALEQGLAQNMKNAAKVIAVTIDAANQNGIKGDITEKFIEEISRELKQGNRDKLVELFQGLSQELSDIRGSVKSGVTGNNRNDQSTDGTVSLFGAEAGTRYYEIDNLIIQGKHTKLEISKVIGCSYALVKKRVAKIIKSGYVIQTSDAGAVFYEK